MKAMGGSVVSTSMSFAEETKKKHQIESGATGNTREDEEEEQKHEEDFKEVEVVEHDEDENNEFGDLEDGF